MLQELRTFHCNTMINVEYDILQSMIYITCHCLALEFG